MMQQDVLVTRTHGLCTTANLNEVEWDFSTYVPQKIDVPKPVAVQAYGSLFGKWVGYDDEVVALAREGGEECEGMPVLSVVKGLDLEMMDFLVSAWCVAMWGEVGKRC